jgi:hypothetical protein
MNPDTPPSGAAATHTGEDQTRESRGAGSSDASASLSNAVPGLEPGDASSSAGDAPRETRKVVAKLKEKTTSQLDAQKSRVARVLGSVAAAARETSRQLKDERRNVAASVVETAANQLDRLSEQLRSKQLDELAEEARRIARERPALVLGTSLVAGFAAARFARSSSVERGWSNERRDSGERRPAAREGSGAASRGWPGDSHSNSGAPRGSY